MSQLFANINTPEINQLTLNRVLSPTVKENIFQEIITRPGLACTEKYTENTDCSEVQVIRVKPNDKQARELGADVNGGWFNSEEATTPSSAAYGVKLISQIDHVIDIPLSASNMINVDLLEAETKNLVGKVNRNINAITIATQLAKNFNDVQAGSIPKKWIEIEKANLQKGDMKNALISANSNLDEGNEYEGVDFYPIAERCYVVRPSVRSQLMRDGEIIVGGSNYAQEMLAKGGLSPNGKHYGIDGYAGDVDGVPVFVGSPAIFKLAEKYLGLSVGALDEVYALCVSGIGTLRGLAFNSAITTVPSPNGAGIRLQPKYRFGANCIDGLSVSIVVEKNFANPAANGALTVKAPGSRG